MTTHRPMIAWLVEVRRADGVVVHTRVRATSIQSAIKAVRRDPRYALATVRGGVPEW